MNYSDFNTPIFGLQQEDIIIEDTTSIDELNTRIQSRHFPDNVIQSYLHPRATPTKCSRFPMIERRAPTTVPIQRQSTHHPSTNFNPGARPFPFESYLASYDDDVKLRQPMTRLKDNEVYLPHSNSELFQLRVPNPITRNEEQTHPLLFERPRVQGRQVDPLVNNYIGKAAFLNPTMPKTIKNLLKK